MIGTPRSFSIYLDHNNNKDWALLYAGTETKVNEFLKFWAVYRPLSTIQVRYLNSMDGVTVFYQGEANGYVKSRR